MAAFEGKESIKRKGDVLLIMPPLYHTGREPDYNPKEPMSLMVLASELRRNGICTDILDADVEALPLETVVDDILKRAPKVLGISVLQRALPSTETIVTSVRKQGLKETHITLGGITATLSYRTILHRLGNLIDSIVLGEGEETLTKLSQAVLTGQEWRGIPGLAFSQNGTVIYSKPNKIDPSVFPPPSRDYLEFCSRKTGYATILSSRGCYGRCSFCSNYTFESFSSNGPRWRGRNPEEVVEEIAQINRQYGIRVFKFNDPNVFGPGKKGREHVAKICSGIIKRGLNLSLMAFCRGNDILADPTILPLMKQAGFERILIGVESSNNEVLAKFRKDETIEEIEKAIDLIQKHNMSIVIGFMIFNPYTSLQTLKQDLAFLKRRGFSVTLSKALRIFDGIPMQAYLDEEGRLITRNPFEGYHEYIVSPQVASIYMGLKTVAVAWTDTLKKYFQSRIWELKKGPSFYERAGYYSLTDAIFNLETSLLEMLISWSEDGFTREGIQRALNELWEKQFIPILSIIGISNTELFPTPNELSESIYTILKKQPFNTFPEKYRWQND